MGMKIIKIVPTTFAGNDGQDVQGCWIYLIPAGNQGGAQPERAFLSDERRSNMAYDPKVGDTVYLFRNTYGRIVDMLPV